MAGLRNATTNLSSALHSSDSSKMLGNKVSGLDGLKRVMQQQSSAESQHQQEQVSFAVPAGTVLSSTGVASFHQRISSRVPHVPQKLPVAQDIPFNMFAWEQHESDNCQSHASSGSDHEPSSVCLAALVSEFMEREGQSTASNSYASRFANSSDGFRCFSDDEDEDGGRGLLELTSAIENLGACTTNLERKVFSDVVTAMKLARGDAAAMALQEVSTTTRASQQMPNAATAAAVAAASSSSSPFFRRAVMGRLRLAGYNAAVCKSRWEHMRGFPGGDYEYIDVVFSSESSPVPRERLLVDIDFRAQFQVARPTTDLDAVLHSAPIIFVGRVDRLKQLVDVLSDACRRSMQSQGMHLPPWRRVEYLRSKWLSPYKRTTNVFPTQSSSLQQTPNSMTVTTSSESNLKLAAMSTAGFVGGMPPTPSTRRDCGGAAPDSLFSEQNARAKRNGLPQQVTARGCLGMLLRQQMIPGMEQSGPMPAALLGL